MKKTISVCEFAEICNKERFSCFLFSSSDQIINDDDGRLTYSLRFSGFASSMQPNTVLFCGDGGTLRVSRIVKIQYAALSDTTSVFIFVCGDKNTMKNHSKYVVGAVK